MAEQNYFDIPDYFREKMSFNTENQRGACRRDCMNRECPNEGNCVERHRENRPPYPQYPYHPRPMGKMCRCDEDFSQPMPYYRAYPGSLKMQQELDDMNDWDNLMERYPKNAKIIQTLVDEQSDRMDFDGSMMFDEYPDSIMIDKMVDEIYERFMDEMKQGTTEEEMMQESCKECDNAINDETLKELIMVMLFNEMYRRRCRKRMCNRWW